MKKQYRIVRDKFRGYEVQKRYFLLPIWFQIRDKELRPINTNGSIEEAKKLVEWDKKRTKVVDISKWI